jgi:hypothetical protein
MDVFQLGKFKKELSILPEDIKPLNQESNKKPSEITAVDNKNPIVISAPSARQNHEKFLQKKYSKHFV